MFTVYVDASKRYGVSGIAVVWCNPDGTIGFAAKPVPSKDSSELELDAIKLAMEMFDHLPQVMIVSDCQSVVRAISSKADSKFIVVSPFKRNAYLQGTANTLARTVCDVRGKYRDAYLRNVLRNLK